MTKKDVFYIHSAVEFANKPGGELSRHYKVSGTTIKRIKDGDNFLHYKKEYNLLPEDERLMYFKELCKIIPNLKNRQKRGKIHLITRLLVEKQVHLILVNEENQRILPITKLKDFLQVPTSSCIYNVLRKRSYLEYLKTYNLLSCLEKQQLVSLLREQQQKIL